MKNPEVVSVLWTSFVHEQKDEVMVIVEIERERDRGGGGWGG